MASTRQEKPNKKMQALYEKYPEQTKAIKAATHPSTIRFMNALAEVYGEDQEGLLRITENINSSLPIA